MVHNSEIEETESNWMRQTDKKALFQLSTEVPLWTIMSGEASSTRQVQVSCKNSDTKRSTKSYNTDSLKSRKLFCTKM